MKKQKTTDLFRFATLRAPELISEDRKRLGFVFHPDPTKSAFLNPSGAGGNPPFSPFPTVQAVKDLAGAMWEFSNWLNQNKFKLQRDTPWIAGCRPLNWEIPQY